ncbi:unnamed protein product [Aphanomyces euteiches]
MEKLRTSRRFLLVAALWCIVIQAQEHESSTSDGKKSEGHEEATAEQEHDEVYYNVLASVVTITGAEWLRESTEETNMPFVNTIFNELTTLGFIGSILFLMSKSGYLARLSQTLFGKDKEMELQETIEMLHMALFLFVIIFLGLCIVLLNLGVRVQMELREFERRAPYVQVVVADYCLATEAPCSWKEKYSLKRWFDIAKRNREMVYVSLRRRFVDYRSNHPDPIKAKELAKDFQLEQDTRFPFNEYLAIISGEVMARLIQIDAITWIALEVCIVGLIFICWRFGPDNEIFVILAGGGLLIVLNQIVYRRIRHMRKLLTPPLLFKKAERYRAKPKWRAQHKLPMLPPPSVADEKVPLLLSEEKLTTDALPPYLLHLPNGGIDMDPTQLADAQKALLGGGNGVLLALFSTRLVFLFTALHFSVFVMRTSGQLIHRDDFGLVVKVILFVLLALPSLIVASVSIMIARDGLYCFNIEAMKVPRVINKVMRILKARQTLRTLRFVAEMKVYLREHHSTPSQKSKTDGYHEIPISESPTKRSSFELAMPTFHAEDGGKLQLLSPSSRMKYEEPMSPINEPGSKSRKQNKYDEESERREINSIFCLFDRDKYVHLECFRDGHDDISRSGAITRDEMESLLHVISPDMTEEQISSIIGVLDEGHTGEITFDEFYHWCRSHIHQHSSKHSKHHLIKEVFNMIDTDGSGYITVDEFVAIFKALGQSLDHEDVRELVYQIDRNSDGKIDFEEFEKMLHKNAI